MNFSDLFTRSPINKSAAEVTSQSGCSEALTLEQKLDNAMMAKRSLIDENNKIKEEIDKGGMLMHSIDLEIGRLNRLIKAKRRAEHEAKVKMDEEKREAKKVEILNKDIATYRELKKILKSRMPIREYIALMELADRKAEDSQESKGGNQ
ncbi:MAG: hypothetical protein ACPHUL_00200 [Marinomonas gallaica]